MSAILKAVQRLFRLLIKVIGNLAGQELPALVVQQGGGNHSKDCYFLIICVLVPQKDFISTLMCLKLEEQMPHSSTHPPTPPPSLFPKVLISPNFQREIR